MIGYSSYNRELYNIVTLELTTVYYHSLVEHGAAIWYYTRNFDKHLGPHPTHDFCGMGGAGGWLTRFGVVGMTSAADICNSKANLIDNMSLQRVETLF